MVTDSQKAAEVTLQPVDRYQMDGAILFSDILIVPMALGQDLWFEAGEGPRLGSLPASLQFKDLAIAPILETLRLVRRRLEGTSVTTLGFVGAPWTVATYMIEQRKPTFDKSRAFLETSEAETLFNTLIQATIRFAKAQISAGAEVIKIFDSWAGQLPNESSFKKWSLDPMVEIASALAPTPIIFFPRGKAKMVQHFEKAFPHPFGFAVGDGDDMAEIRDLAGPQVCLQGNLSPQVLLDDPDVQIKATNRLLDIMKEAPISLI